MRGMYNLHDGVVTLKPSTSDTIINYVSFLISHHNYDARKFANAEGTELGKHIESIIFNEEGK